MNEKEKEHNLNIHELFANQKVIDVDVNNEMKQSFIEYAMSVIVARALPDVRDGLKPIHRRILYTMYEDGITPDHAYLKSAATVGDVMGKYHPHGDAAIYDSMVRMAQPFSMRYMLIQGQGNFGNIDGDSAAAQRYTEARMSRIAMEMLKDIDKETVSFTPSYDGRNDEPVVLPSRYPNLLVNGSTGIAVGMATSIPPHNLGEVIDATVFLMENPDCTVDHLLHYIKGPDFPTGGQILGKSGLRQAYHTGRGKIQVRSKVTVETYKENRQRIVVTEIPYMVNKSKLLQDIADHVNNKKIEGVHDLRDESDKRGMSIVIELKKDANPQLVLNKLYTYTQLQDTCSVIMLALVNGEPKILNLKEMLENYIGYQKEVIIKRTQFELKKALERAHILEGLLKAIDHIDEIIKIIRASESIQAAKDSLIERFQFSDIQAQRIVDMRLGQLTGLERNRLLEEFNSIESRISGYREILADDKKVCEVIKNELIDIRNRYNDERRTEIVPIENDIDVEDLIENKTCVYTFTSHGYLKRQPEDIYKVQKRGGMGVSAMTTKEEDYATEMFTGSTHNNILFFTSHGRVFRRKGYEIPESSRQAMGMNVVNLLELEQDERVTAMIPHEVYDEKLVLNMVTRKGITKRCVLGAYRNLHKHGLRAIDLPEGDELISVMLTDGTKDIMVVTHKGMAVRYNENDIRVMGRNAYGVRAVRLSEDDYVIGTLVCDDEKSILTVTENGYGKRTLLSAFGLQHRGGKGLRAHKISEKTGLLAGFKAVGEDEDLVVISVEGILIRIKVSDIPLYGRTSGGVRIMRFRSEDKVVTVAALPSVPEEETGKLELSAEDTSEASEDTTTEEEAVTDTDIDDGEEDISDADVTDSDGEEDDEDSEKDISDAEKDITDEINGVHDSEDEDPDASSEDDDNN